MIKEIKNIAENNFNEIVKIRRFLHQNPELSFKEFNTSKYIQSLLSEHNIPYKWTCSNWNYCNYRG